MTFWASRARASQRTWLQSRVRNFAFLLATVASQALLAGGALAQDTDAQQPHTNYGGVGLIDMPSARMAPDGELSAGASFMENIQHYNLGFQVLPWLETSFRYSGLQGFEPVTGLSTYYDRSFGFKARIWNEDEILPAVALGINDIVGTGVYSGEYLVASKKFGSVDTTLGMGWGRLGSTMVLRNPLTLFSNSFNNRPNGLSGAGDADFSVLFHGPKVGLFGGAVWHTPIEDLSVLLEYSSDKYTQEADFGTFVPRNQVNMGLSYKPIDSLTVGLDWLYGKSFGVSASFLLNPTQNQFSQRISPDMPPETVRTDRQQQEALNVLLGQKSRVVIAGTHFGYSSFVDALMQQDDVRDVRLNGRNLVLVVREASPDLCQRKADVANLYNSGITSVTLSGPNNHRAHCAVSQLTQVATTIDPNDNGKSDFATPKNRSNAEAIRAIRADAAKQRVQIEAIRLSTSEVVVYYQNNTYFSETDAIERLTRVLMADAPPDVERFRIISVGQGGPEREFDALRSPLERSIVQLDDQQSIFTRDMLMRPPPMDNPVISLADRKVFPRFTWDISPQLRESFFDPNRPLGVQLLGAASGSVELLRGLSINASVEGNIVDNFETNRASDSQLPHVRSDFLKYFTQGKNGIAYLNAGYMFRASPNVFATIRAGYLESMFAGVGGELLWRPEGQRWALGGDVYDVQQRAFDRLFGLLPYRVVTGHVSLYYDSPWYNLNFVLRAGQYLAGDRGLTMEVTRRFNTGVEVGAFFTRTNVPAAQFGEGSFDKGIIIRIPLGWALPIDTQNQLNLDLRPVQRDGGQRLAGDAILYDSTRRDSLGEMQRQLGN